MSEGNRGPESTSLVLLLACLVAVLLLVGLLAFAGVGWFALQARQAEQRAMQERMRAEQAMQQALQAEAAAVQQARQAEAAVRRQAEAKHAQEEPEGSSPATEENEPASDPTETPLQSPPDGDRAPKEPATP